MTLSESAAPLGWRFGRNWGLAFLGFPLAGLAAQAVVGGIDTPLDGLIGGLASGAVIGLAQWLALRSLIPLPRVWIAATAVGLGLGLALGVTLLGTETAGADLLRRAALTGAVLGGGQSLVLRRLGVPAFPWLITVTLGWALGWNVTRAAGVDLTPDFSVFGATGALTFQVLTGAVWRWWLLR